MKLLVINQYYPPGVSSTGQLAAEICASLVARGIDVHVVTAQPSYSASSCEALAYEERDGVHVHRISLGGLKGRESLLVRLRGYRRFLVGAYKMAKAIVAIEKPDGILTFHNPPLVGWIGAKLARRHGLRFTYVPYDIHPDILIATKWLYMPWPAIWSWNRLNRFILGEASAVVALGQGMKDTLVGAKRVPADKVHVIPLWGRPELDPSLDASAMRIELGIRSNETMLLYSGNMGIMHPLEWLIEAAEKLRDQPIKFVFVGDGAKRVRLMQAAVRLSLNNVVFLPFQSEERFAQLVSASDACIVALEPGLEKLALPSRAFTFLSAGRPLLTLMAPKADVAELVAETNCGWNVASSHELISHLRSLLENPELLKQAAANARKVYDERFCRERILDQYHAVIAA